MHVTGTLTAENTFTDALAVFKGSANLSISGTFSATATLQRSFDGGSTYLDVTTYTEAAERVFDEPEGALYRVGVKTGAYTSGSVVVRIGQRRN